MREIEGEAGLRELLDISRHVGTACPTVGDWLRRMGEGKTGLDGLGRVNPDMSGVAQVLKRDSRTEYTLDVDATVIEAEKAEAQWTYKKEKGYQPLLGFLSEPGLGLADEFHDGSTGSP